MFGSRDIYVFDLVVAKIGGDAAHRAFGEQERLADDFEGVGVEPGDGGATLAPEPKVFGDERAVGEGEQPVVAAVGGEASLGLDGEAVGVEAVQVRAVHRHDRAVRMGDDCPAPDVFATRQLG